MKVSTAELVTMELENYLDGILSGCDLDDTNLDRFVTGKALELLKRLPQSERAYAIGKVLAKPDYDCVNGFPYNQEESEFFMPPTEFEIDITHLELENPDDFYVREIGGCKLAYYAMNYGAYIALDLDKLEEYVQDYLTDQKN